MSNPRRFGKDVLVRVTGPMTRQEAKRRANKFRTSGFLARVDSFEGEFAVWSNRGATSKVVVAGKQQFLARKQIEIVLDRYNRIRIREIDEPMPEDVRKRFGRVLAASPIIPRGKNVGIEKWHDCERNAASHFRATGDTAFIGFLITGYKEPIMHAFNVRDGKVYEVTGGIGWTKNIIYVGVPIPPNELAGFKYQRNNWNIKWLRAQRNKIRWLKS